MKVLLLGGGAAVTTTDQAQAALSLSSPILAKLEEEAGLLARMRCAGGLSRMRGVSAEEITWPGGHAEPLEVGSDARAALHLTVLPPLHCRHPNVVNFYGVCRDPPCILTEYCEWPPARLRLLLLLRCCRM